MDHRNDYMDDLVDAIEDEERSHNSARMTRREQARSSMAKLMLMYHATFVMERKEAVIVAATNLGPRGINGASGQIPDADDTGPPGPSGDGDQNPAEDLVARLEVLKRSTRLEDTRTEDLIVSVGPVSDRYEELRSTIRELQDKIAEEVHQGELEKIERLERWWEKKDP